MIEKSIKKEDRIVSGIVQFRQQKLVLYVGVRIYLLPLFGRRYKKVSKRLSSLNTIKNTSFLVLYLVLIFSFISVIV